MTCIVGLVEKGTVWLGGDSISGNSSQWRAQRVVQPKVFRKGPLVVGFTSSWRMGQLLEYKLVLPEHGIGVDARQWIATDFADAVRKVLIDAGFAKKEHNVEEGGRFLVGFAGRLFQVDSDFHVDEMADRYTAIGSGENYALGVLHATADLRWKPRPRLTRALAAAAHFSVYVGRPFRFVWTG